MMRMTRSRTLSSRIDGHARAMKDSVLRAQGRFGALHHPPPSLACRPAHKQEVADNRDRQPGLHRLPQLRYRLAGQPRVFGLRGRIDRKRPPRSVGHVEGKLGQADVRSHGKWIATRSLARVGR